MTDTEPQQRRARLDSLDLLRGLVMVLMALDHVRDFVAPMRAQPELIPGIGVSWFMTRWVTHFCAPVFVFLAGVSAWLYGSRGRSTNQISRFLLSRGIWLIVLEVTVISASWTFTPPLSILIILQVIFAIGAGMVLLAGLVWLPRGVIFAIGIAILAGHNLMDGSTITTAFTTPNQGMAEFADAVLRSGQGYVQVGGPIGGLVGGRGILFTYPILPWASLLLLGYTFGPMIGDSASRARNCVRLGLVMTLGFVILRATGSYGDPRPFVAGDGLATSFISFLNTQKYPPSLQYVLMTLGPALVLLGWLFSRPTPRGTGWLVTFGRVPLFYYVLHIPLANAAGALWFQMTLGLDRWVFAIATPPVDPAYEPRLLPVYAVWLAVIIILYPVCAAYARFRQGARGWWWSYL